METEVLDRLLEQVKQIAQKAGQAILAVSSQLGDVETKEDGSPLTRADMASHNAIQAGLEKLQPVLPILSEEGDLQKDIATWNAFWCVDPLDGTKEFVKGLGEYTVNIAIVDRGMPILGVIYIPTQKVLYCAAKGKGAWKQVDGQSPEHIAASACSQAKTAVVSRSHLSEDTETFLKRLGVVEMIQHGSSLKICAVAEGKADLYPRHGPTCLWDTAAGVAIAIEAGCVVVDLQGKALSFDPQAGIKHKGFLVYPSQLHTAIENAL